MNEELVLYTYKCSYCKHEGHLYLDDDGYDGIPASCDFCLTTVILNWDDGVHFDTNCAF